MKGDFSRISHDKTKHYTAVFSQQGRVQLDSDWNEQALIIHDLLKNNFSDIVGDFFCIRDSFRICKKIPLDHMLDSELWYSDKKKSEDSNILFTNEHKPMIDDNSFESGSLLVTNSNIIERTFDSLDLSRSQLISIKVKPIENNSNLEKNENYDITLILYKQTDKNLTKIVFTQQCQGAKDSDGFFTVTFPLNDEYGIVVSDSGDDNNFDLSNVSKISIEWSMKTPVCIGIIETEPLIPLVTGDLELKNYSWVSVNDEIYTTEIDITKIYNGKPTIIKPNNLSEISWQFQFPKNFNSLSTITFASEIFFKPSLFIVTDSDDEIELPIFESKNNDLGWNQYKFDVKRARVDAINQEKDFRKIKSIGIKNSPLEELRFSELLGSIDFENDFVIMGKGLDPNSNSRMYVSGILCQKEFNETFLTQSDYPISQNLLKPEGIESDKNITRTHYLAYADVWERGISYIEDPDLKEIALSGPDTTTRIKTICQIKLREIPIIENFNEKLKMINDEIKKLKNTNSGRLSTIISLDTNQSTDYSGIDNRLYKIQIHESGSKEDNTATFKWSKDNGSTAYPLSSCDSFSVTLMPSVNNFDIDFKIGDLIEIIDDFDELSELPRGNLRRITSIDVDSSTLRWTSSNHIDISGINYLNDPITKIFLSTIHPKIIKWDGIKKINSESQQGVLLADDTPSKMVSDGEGVKIKFTDGNYWCGDYWNFYTRTLTNSVQKLNYILPNGTKHLYAPLALIEKNDKQLQVILDLRKSIKNANKDDSKSIESKEIISKEEIMPKEVVQEKKTEEIDYDKLAKMVLETIVGKENARLLMDEDENVRIHWLMKIKKLLKN
jgi:hypothetical protein